jgi:hypothetical protein
MFREIRLSFAAVLVAAAAVVIAIISHCFFSLIIDL